MTRIGGWLFRWRTVLPVPLGLLILLWPHGNRPWTIPVVAVGVCVVAVGEGLRLWGVRHIGAISRTRSGRLGPLVMSGPFALARNPLYEGNIALWTGMALTADLPRLAPVILIVLAAEYHAIVRWEERLLVERHGGHYAEYAAHVPRWMPSFDKRAFSADDMPFSWRETVFSERGTLIALAVGFVLLALKATLNSQL